MKRLKRYAPSPRPPDAGNLSPPSRPPEDTAQIHQSQLRPQYFGANVQGFLAVGNDVWPVAIQLGGWDSTTTLGIVFMLVLGRIVSRWLPFHYAARKSLRQHEIIVSANGDVQIRPATPVRPTMPEVTEAVVDDRPRLAS